VDGEIRLSYTELNEQVNRIGPFFQRQGLKTGDRVATVCANSWQFLVVIYALHKTGLVWVPINHGLDDQTITYIIGHAEARALVVDGAFATRLEAMADCPVVLALGDESPGITPFAQALDDGDITEPTAHIEDRDLCQIMYTSGTTGHPKGVMQSHLAVYLATLSNAIELEVHATDAIPCMLPLFHCTQHVLSSTIMHLGGKNVIMPRFEPRALMEAIHKERISLVIGLPMMYRAILNHPERARFDLKSLRLCLYAMAPMDEPTLRRCIHELCENFALVSGQTEVYPATVMFKPEEQLRRFGPYWGTPVVIDDLAIMDDDGNLLGRGEVGEIVHRGPNVMLGYYKDPNATEKSRAFGWHHTGDLGKIDPDGQLLFMDRKKDMIKSGGENVASIKVESVLLAHPAVANAAVVGLPHERWSEAVSAFVVLKPDQQTNAEEIIAFCRERLGDHEVPKAVIFIDALPLTQTGKVQKQALRQQYQRQFNENKRS
jgi:long-chain acyl-CoA synthetase